jgi:uncharacterized protein
MIELILTISAFFTAVISAIVGMAGGIVLLSIMTFFLDLAVIVPIHGLVQLFSNATRTLSLRQHVEARIFLPMALTLPFGTFVATQLIRSVDNKEVFYFLIAALIFYALFKPKRLPSLKIPYWGFAVLGFFVGVLNPLVGATGPFMAPFYLRDDLAKEQIVATKASVQAFGHALKIPAFLYLGFDYGAYWLMTTLMVIGVIFGTRYGVTLLAKVPEKTFRMIFKTALFLAACRILYNATASLL